MKILCIGDSLGLPREGCSVEETWPSLLRKNYPQHTIIEEFQRERLIDNAVKNYNNKFKQYGADIIILQLGICDCAPRHINKTSFVNRLIRKSFSILGLSDLYWKKVKSRPRRPNCVHTKPKRFTNLYNQLVSGAVNDGATVIIIEIGHGGASVLMSSPFFNSNVDAYNCILKTISKNHNEKVYIVDPLNEVDDGLFVDGYHCNGKGMRKVYDELCGILNVMNQNDSEQTAYSENQ